MWKGVSVLFGCAQIRWFPFLLCLLLEITVQSMKNLCIIHQYGPLHLLSSSHPLNFRCFLDAPSIVYWTRLPLVGSPASSQTCLTVSSGLRLAHNHDPTAHHGLGKLSGLQRHTTLFPFCNWHRCRQSTSSSLPCIPFICKKCLQAHHSNRRPRLAADCPTQNTCNTTTLVLCRAFQPKPTVLNRGEEVGRVISSSSDSKVRKHPRVI